MPLLQVEDLRTHYYTDSGPVKAADKISFTLEKGESIGLAGESGCGKTTVAMSIMRLIKGGAVVGGKIMLGDLSLLDMPMDEFRKVRWERISLISQAAMGALNPVYTVGAQIVEAIRIHWKMSRKDAWNRARELLAQVKVDPKRVKSFPHELSGGMRQRVMIAMSLACDPDIIIADEPTTALDVVTQVQVLRLLIDLQKRLGLSLIYISHELSVLGQACDRLIIMYAGKIVEMGKTADIFASPQHPYTQKLLSSLMDIHSDCTLPESIPGKPPDLLNPPEGCRFSPRCTIGKENCMTEEPPLIEVAPGHYVACHRDKET
ncbi:ABC transporter ATP-binding protein [Chloroflexota bacterium]